MKTVLIRLLGIAMMLGWFSAGVNAQTTFFKFHHRDDSLAAAMDSGSPIGWWKAVPGTANTGYYAPLVSGVMTILEVDAMAYHFSPLGGPPIYYQISASDEQSVPFGSGGSATLGGLTKVNGVSQKITSLNGINGWLCDLYAHHGYYVCRFVLSAPFSGQPPPAPMPTSLQPAATCSQFLEFVTADFWGNTYGVVVPVAPGTQVFDVRVDIYWGGSTATVISQWPNTNVPSLSDSVLGPGNNPGPWIFSWSTSPF